MDRLGRRLGLSLGYVLGIVGAILSVAAIVEGSFWGFLAGAVLLGMMRGTAEQGRYVAAEVVAPPRRARIIGIIVFAGTIGAVGGPLLVDPSGKWATSWGLPLSAGPYALTAVFMLLAVVIVFLLLRPDPLHVGRALEAEAAQPETPGAPPSPDTEPDGSLVAILSRPDVQIGVLAMAIGQLVMTMLMVITPLYMDHQEHSARLISWVIMAHTLGMFGLSGVTGWIVDRLGRLPTVAGGTLLLIVAAVVTPIATGVPVLALALFLLGLGWNFCFVAGSSLVADAVTAGERGRAQGASETIIAIASGGGSLGSGLLFQQSGMTLPSLAGLLLSLGLLAAIVVAAWSRRGLAAGVGQSAVDYLSGE
jgi:MFS family permease